MQKLKNKQERNETKIVSWGKKKKRRKMKEKDKGYMRNEKKMTKKEEKR